MSTVETVSGVLEARTQAAEPWGAVAVVSVVAHALLLSLLLLTPTGGRNDVAPRTVMSISLGGFAGPRTSGMTPVGGRAVQAVTPQKQKVRRVVPPSAKPPEMTLPAKRTRSARPVPAVATSAGTGRRLSTGEEVQEGSARADTGARGQGFGLTGGGGSGSGAYLDVGDFCCPEYLETVIQVIHRNWVAGQGVTGQTLMKFTVLRSGMVSNVVVERPSGFIALDMAAQRALLLTRQVPALPQGFSNPDLTIHLRFDYQR